jgi:hypothetical protein
MKFDPRQSCLNYLDPGLPVPMPTARATDPPTSQEAGRDALRWRSGQHLQILRALESGPASKTLLSERTGIDNVAVARRVSELLGAEEIVVVSHDGRSPHGKRERVYGLPEGRR